MKKKFYGLTVICEGAVPDFTVDEQSLASFEKSLTPVLVEKKPF